jgi:Na+/proline symporter
VESLTGDIVVVVIIIVTCIWWFLSEKNKTIRKYIIIQGLSSIIVVATYYVIILTSLTLLSLVGLSALICGIVFYIKAILLKRRLKKSGDKPPEQ